MTRGGPRHAEELNYTLTQGGRYAGEQEWATRPERGGLNVRVSTDFGGVLPAQRRVQISQQHPSGHSRGYSEAEGTGRDSRPRVTFETVFDDEAGLITLRQNKGEATAPLLTAYHDPVSLLGWLRTLPPEGEQPAPLVGGRVHVQRLPDSELAGRPVAGYFLRPGGAYVYVELDEPQRILRLVQPSDYGLVEASLNLGAELLRGGSDGRQRSRPGGQKGSAQPRRRRA